MAMDALAAIEEVVNSAVKVEPLFQEYAMKLLGMLAVISLSWSGIRHMLEGDSDRTALAMIIKTLILCGMASAIIGANSGSGGFGKQIITGFDTVANAATGNSVDVSNPGAMVKTVATKMVATIGLVLIGKTEKEEAASPTVPSGSASTDAGKAGNFFSNLLHTAFSDVFMSGMWAMLISLAYKIVMAAALAVATLIFVAQFFFTQITLNIGLALMPIMVPWIVLEQTAFLFEGWLKFMITAGMAKVIGAMIFALSFKAMDKAVEVANQGYESSDFGVVVISYMTSFLIVGMLAYLMMQATAIAGGLIHGRGIATWHPQGKMGGGGGKGSGGKGSKGKGSGSGSTPSTPGSGAINKLAGSIAGGIKGGMTGKGAAAGAKAGATNGLAGAMAKATTGSTTTPAVALAQTSSAALNNVRAKMQSVGIKNGRRS